MLQFLPGTDFIFSGYAAEPNYDNMFAGSNFDAEDFDDYNVLQRDMQVDGGLRPVTEEEVIHVRNKAARAVQAAAILDKDFHVLSGINTPNDYMGPGTGYRVQGERWEEIKKIPHIINPQDI